MKKIAILTGTRADYGLFYPVLKEIERTEGLQLNIIATGMHLSHKHGYTIQEMENDGFYVNEKVDISPKDDSMESMIESLGVAIIKLTPVLSKMKPDILLVLGDRDEALAGAIAAAHLNIPVGHLFGGDTASGSNIDDSNRHAITKFAHLHFTATEEHRQRVIKLGEEKDKVFFVGSCALDNIRNESLLSKEEIKDIYNLDLEKDFTVTLYHPTTVNYRATYDEMKEILQSLVNIDKQAILIYPNTDSGSRGIIKAIEEYKDYSNIYAYPNLPFRHYLSLLKECSLLIGNSSSGMFEAPSFGTPVINIGERQKGRYVFGDIYDVKEVNRDLIKQTIEDSLIMYPKSKRIIPKITPIGDGTAAKKIARVLKSTNLDNSLLRKRITY